MAMHVALIPVFQEEQLNADKRDQNLQADARAVNNLNVRHAGEEWETRSVSYAVALDLTVFGLRTPPACNFREIFGTLLTLTVQKSSSEKLLITLKVHCGARLASNNMLKENAVVTTVGCKAFATALEMTVLVAGQ